MLGVLQRRNVSAPRGGASIAATWGQPGTPEEGVVSCMDFVIRHMMFELASIFEYVNSSPKQQSFLGMTF